MYYFEDAVAEATAAAGMRALCAQTVLRFPAPDATSYEESLARARDFIQRWNGPPADRAGAGAARALHLHAGDPARLRRARRRVRRAAAYPPVGDAAGGRRFAQAHGMPVVPWVKKHGLFDAKVLAAHCVHVDDGEIRALKNANAGVAHNPTSNLKLARRRGAGRADAGARRQRRHRHRRRRVEQRPRHVRRDAAGGAARQGDERRSDGDSGARRAGDGDADRRGGDAHGSPDRIARGRQARRPDRARPRSPAQRARVRPRRRRHLRADRLRVEVDATSSTSCATADG